MKVGARLRKVRPASHDKKTQSPFPSKSDTPSRGYRYWPSPGVGLDLWRGSSRSDALPSDGRYYWARRQHLQNCTTVSLHSHLHVFTRLVVSDRTNPGITLPFCDQMAHDSGRRRDSLALMVAGPKTRLTEYRAVDRISLRI